jgi:hypothetical protein
MITRTSLCLATIVLLLSTMLPLGVNACQRYRQTHSSAGPVEEKTQ